MRWLGMSAMLLGFVAIGIALYRMSSWGGAGSILGQGLIDFGWVIVLLILVFLMAMGIARITSKVKDYKDRHEKE